MVTPGLVSATPGITFDSATQPLSKRPLSEQKVIVGRIDTAFARVDRLASATTNARKLIDHLDRAILAKPPTRAAKNVGAEKSVKSLGGQKKPR